MFVIEAFLGKPIVRLTWGSGKDSNKWKRLCR